MGSHHFEGPSGARYVLSKPSLSLGREARCDVVIDDASISREHARILVKDGVVTVIDNNSRNGTFVDGVRVAPNQQATIAIGQKITFGTYVVTLRGVVASAAREAPGARDALGSATVEFSVEQFMSRADIAPMALDRVLADVLYRAPQALFPAQPIDALLDGLLHLLLDYVPASFASVQLLEPESGELVASAVLAKDSTDATFLMSRGLAEKVIMQKKAVLLRDRLSDEEFKNRQSLVKAGITSAMAAPIFDGDLVLGVLYSHIKDGLRELSEVDVAVASVLASLAGTAILAARMMTDLLEAQAALQRENEALRAALGQADA